MNKTDLAKAIAANNSYNISQKCAAEMIDTLTSEIVKAVKKGDTVQLIGFASFSQGKRAARNGINPATKKKIKIPASKVMKVKVSPAVKALLNGKKK